MHPKEMKEPKDPNGHEIRKLRRELGQANEKVSSLTSQLATNVSHNSCIISSDTEGLSYG